MTAAAFDTYTAAKRLRDAGFDESQTEAAVTMVREAVSADREQLATKADLAELRAELANVRAEIGTIRWVVGIQSAITVATFAIVAAKLL